MSSKVSDCAVVDVDVELICDDCEGEIPRTIGSLAALEEFNAGSNQLVGNIPREIGNLSALTNLLLFGNRLTG
jgi:hypothetical protein